MAIDDTTFKAIEHALTSIQYSGNGCGYNFSMYLQGFRDWDQYGAKGYTPNAKEYEGIKRFVGVLRAQNSRAFHAAYLHRDDMGNYRTPKYNALREHDTLPRKKEPLTPVQLLKSLECISYNLDAHEVPLLKTVINCLRSQIIDNLSEYKAANWG